MEKILDVDTLGKIGEHLKKADLMINSLSAFIKEESLVCFGENANWVIRTFVNTALDEIEEVKKISGVF
jgi:hypothetical protein